MRLVVKTVMAFCKILIAQMLGSLVEVTNKWAISTINGCDSQRHVQGFNGFGTISTASSCLYNCRRIQRYWDTSTMVSDSSHATTLHNWISRYSSHASSINYSSAPHTSSACFNGIDFCLAPWSPLKPLWKLAPIKVHSFRCVHVS